MAQKKKKKKAPEEEAKLHEQIVKQLLTLSTSGFGLVAALAWNDTIQQIVKQYLEPRIPGSGVFSRLIYAMIVTLLAVTVTYQLSKISSRFKTDKK